MSKNRLDIMLDSIRGDMKSKGLKGYMVAEALGVSKNTVSNMLTGKNGAFPKLRELIEYVDSYEGE